MVATVTQSHGMGETLGTERCHLSFSVLEVLVHYVYFI